VNDRVLNYVAEPVANTGEVMRQGEPLTLRADPRTYRRVTQYLPETAPPCLVLSPSSEEVLFLVAPSAITMSNRKMTLIL
jgi:hypothetical protein